MDKKLILKEIKRAYKFDSDAQFARFLGISPQTLSSWYRRNIYDVDILATKCVEVNPEYILTGKGQIMRNGDVVLANVGDHNSNSGNITNVDARLLDMLEKAQDERLELLSIIKQLTAK